MSVTEQCNRSEPVVQRIYDEFFASLEASPEFDAPTIRQLRVLTLEGDMKKHEKVSDAIAGNVGGEDETPGA